MMTKEEKQQLNRLLRKALAEAPVIKGQIVLPEMFIRPVGADDVEWVSIEVQHGYITTAKGAKSIY